MTNQQDQGMNPTAVKTVDQLVPAVQITDGRKTFGSKEVLKSVSLKIMPGEVLSLIGPSGAGKSTLLRCLTMLDTFDAGTMSYGDTQVCVNDRRGRCQYDRHAVKTARMAFGLAFQNYNLFPHYTVLQNIIDAPLVVQKRSRDEVMQQAQSLMSALGLTEHASKVPCELSGGQQQRVAIARALCMNPAVMYFDEATSALDPNLTAEMASLVRRLASEGMAVGIVTHEMDFALDVSDRIAFLCDGTIAEEGSAREVLTNPQDERTRAFLSKEQNA